MSAVPQRGGSSHPVSREVRHVITVLIAGTCALAALFVLGHQVLAWSDERENAYYTRASALSDRLFLTLRSVQLPRGIQRSGGALEDPEAFAAAAERAYLDSVAVAEEIAALRWRYESDPAADPPTARLERSVAALRAMHARHEADRGGFASAFAASETYLEIVAAQLRRQFDESREALLVKRRNLLAALAISGVIALILVAFATRRYVRRSLDAIDVLLHADARIQKALEAALREKEVLLKEVYHRVKNNLQVVSGLLNMQGREIRDPEALRLFEESANRIRSMALVHEQLYRSPDLGKIDCRVFLDELAARLAEAYAPRSHQIRIEVRTDDLELDLESAIPCALILNELIANAFRHGFEPSAMGEVRAELGRLEDSRVRLTVSDDGRGFAPDFRPELSTTLGMRIVTTLARQLGGEMRFENRDGAYCELVFVHDGARASRATAASEI